MNAHAKHTTRVQIVAENKVRKNKPGPGRPKGSLNKATASLKAAFQKCEKELVKGAMALTKDDDPRVRHAAIQAAMDRGWGKAPQAVTGEGGEGPVRIVVETGIDRE